MSWWPALRHCFYGIRREQEKKQLILAYPDLFSAQGQDHTICPAKAVLRRVFPSTGFIMGIHDVVLLHHFPCRAIRAVDQREPPCRCRVGESSTPVATHSLDREPLQRRPAVRRIPLLA